MTNETQVHRTLDPHDFRCLEAAMTYPRLNKSGETVWACCESSVGPVCHHRVERELAQAS